MKWRHERQERPEQPDPEAARRRLAEERRRLEEMHAETEKYADLGRRLRLRMERNHISEGLAELYRGRKA